MKMNKVKKLTNNEHPSDRDNNILIIVVTSTGRLIYLNSKLEVLEIKTISNNCLRACCVNLELRGGRRVLGADGKGNLYNEYG